MKSVVVLGGGLAGGFLAAALAERGCRVLLYDDPAAEGASAGAAGLYNVVTGRRMALTWGAPLLVAALDAFFRSPTGQPLARFRQLLPIYRPYPDAAMQDLWSRRFHDPEYQPWIAPVQQPIAPHRYHNPRGGFLVQGVGRVQVAAFLQALFANLQASGRFEHVPQRIDYADLDPEGHRLGCRGASLPFDALVCCEGMAAAANPFWDIRALIPLKGQLLRIAASDLRQSEVWVGEGVFILPEGGDCYTLGSTYETRFATAEPTAEGRQLLLEAFHRLLPHDPPPDVLWHWANLRPATADHLPVAGEHRRHAGLFFFNGLGSKGVLHAAAVAPGLADWIAFDRPEALHPAFQFYRPVMVKPKPMAG